MIPIQQQYEGPTDLTPTRVLKRGEQVPIGTEADWERKQRMEKGALEAANRLRQQNEQLAQKRPETNDDLYEDQIKSLRGFAYASRKGHPAYGAYGGVQPETQVDAGL
jgi:hypothetical protein